MNLEVLKKEEKRMNFIMFIIWGFLIPIAACTFVMLFLDGTIEDLSVLLMVVSAIIIKLCENKLAEKAKYCYACIMPICGAITMVVGNDGKFAAMTQAYFLATIMVIAYYDVSVIKVNAIVTIVVNFIAMLIFPEAYLKLHVLIVWIFILIVYLLCAITSYLIANRTYTLFVDVKDKEDEVVGILTKVQSVAKDLSVAGIALTSISQNESASAEELAATSEQLVDNSKVLNGKTDESMSNLVELSKYEDVMVNNVQKVELASKDLIDKSVENEKLLNSLRDINVEVFDSMNVTTNIAQKLSDAVQEIGSTLSLISSISSSTNLLALNASIEAARAGDAGKGFAVVATEVGNLANSTQQSLKEVEAVIVRVQNNVKEITMQIEENSSKLDTQDKYFENVFKSMQDMTELLNASVKAIDTMGKAHNEQAEVIKKTISINHDIAEGIRNAIEQFDAINAMAESNASDTVEVATQANAINCMVEDINGILK